MRGVEEEVFVPEVDEQGAFKVGDLSEDEEVEVDEGKFDDESSSDDDR